MEPVNKHCVKGTQKRFLTSEMLDAKCHIKDTLTKLKSKNYTWRNDGWMLLPWDAWHLLLVIMTLGVMFLFSIIPAHHFLLKCFFCISLVFFLPASLGCFSECDFFGIEVRLSFPGVVTELSFQVTCWL